MDDEKIAAELIANGKQDEETEVEKVNENGHKETEKDYTRQTKKYISIYKIN